MKKVFLLNILALLFFNTYAQNVGIGTSNPHNSAKLDVEANDKGFLPPRLTTAQRNGISSPSKGLIIYNTDTDCLEFYNNTQWISLCETVPPCVNPPSATPSNNSPFCSGTTTLTISATAVAGATYLWNGPNNFTANGQTLSFPNATTALNGTYTVRTFVNGCYSNPLSTTVSIAPSPWVQKASFPISSTAPVVLGRANVVGFSIGDTIYVGGGSQTFCAGIQNDFFAFNPATNTWTQKANTPLSVPAGLGFSNGVNGFIAGGALNCGGATSNLMRYNTNSNSWTTGLAPVPSPFQAANNFNSDQSGNHSYVLGGNSSCFLNTFYKYNHPTNTWSTLANYPGVGRGNTVLMVINGRVFAGMGRDWLCTVANFNDFSEYLPVANNWVAKANYNGTAGYTFGYFVLGDYGYVIDQNLDVNRYDPVMNTWTRLACKCPIIPDFVGVANGKAYVISTSGQGTYEFTP